ncbi:MAG: DUF1254 domain-containing protein [Solimonas sp.]
MSAATESRGWRGPLLLALLVAAGVHLAFVAAYPNLVMRVAMQKLSGGGERLHRWLPAPRVTPEARKIVRPAPEFAYSACVYDLHRGPLRIRVGASQAYWSLSLYAANTDNFLVMRDVDHRDGLDLVVVHGADGGTSGPPGAVQAPTARGIALIRRLASDDAAWAGVETLRKEDACISLES